MWADGIAMIVVEAAVDMMMWVVSWPGRKRGSDGRRLPYERMGSHKRGPCGHVVRQVAVHCPKCGEPL